MRSKLISKSLFNKTSYWLSLTLVLGVMAVIFWFSAQDDAHSDGQSGGLLKFFIDIFVPSYKDMTAQAQKDLYQLFHTLIRKTGHFTEYFVLGAALTTHIKVICKYTNKRFLFFVPLLAGVLYACSDELHQFFVPGRAMLFLDLLIDSLGVTAGICALCFLAKIIKKHKQKKNIKYK